MVWLEICKNFSKTIWLYPWSLNKEYLFIDKNTPVNKVNFLILFILFGYEEKEKLLETVSFLHQYVLHCPKSCHYLKKSLAVFCFFDLIRIFSTYLVTLKMLFTIIFLLLLYYYLYKQNISHWSSCFYWPFGLLKTLTKTEKKKKKTPLYKWFSILGI